MSLQNSCLRAFPASINLMIPVHPSNFCSKKRYFVADFSYIFNCYLHSKETANAVKFCYGVLVLFNFISTPFLSFFKTSQALHPAIPDARIFLWAAGSQNQLVMRIILLQFFHSLSPLFILNWWRLMSPMSACCVSWLDANRLNSLISSLDAGLQQTAWL